jgi:hypothetical protein
MLLTDFSPLRRFITTDLLGQGQLNKYSVGYLYWVKSSQRTEKPYVVASGVMTRVGKSGKPRIKPAEFYVAPVVYKELIDLDYYAGVQHILTKIEAKNVLEMENREFLAWYYANVLTLEKLRLTSVWAEAFDRLSARTSQMARNIGSYTDGQVNDLVGGVVIREHLLSRLRHMYSFVRYHNRPEDNLLLTMVAKHQKTVQDKKVHESVSKHLKHMIAGKKLPKDVVTENANAAKEYEDSGYWV